MRVKLWSSFCFESGILGMLLFVLSAQGNGDAENRTTLEAKFQMYVTNARNAKLDDSLGSGRGLWIAKLSALSELFIANGMDTDSICKELEDFMLNDKYPYNRAIASGGIAATQKKEAIESLSKVLDDSCLFVKCRAAESIISLGDTKNMKALQTFASIATNKKIETMTKKELIRAGESPYLIEMELNKGMLTQKLIAEKTRYRAIVGLHKGNTDYSKKILETLKNDNDSTIRDWAVGKGIEK